MPSLQETARQLVSKGTGILAADESEGTIAKRFAVIGLPVTFETRRDYREMLFRSREAMGQYISGVILTEETLKQDAADGTPFVALLADVNAIPGIKVDRGAFEMPGTKGEKITEGLDGLRQRLKHYAEIGARFAKWRGVIAVSSYAPSRNGIRANAHVLARYAALCQEAGIVPVVEPEVLADGEPGDHGIERCAEVTAETLATVFDELRLAGVDLTGMLLKPNMVTPGVRSQDRRDRAADARRPQGTCAGERAGHRVPFGRAVGRGGDGKSVGDEPAGRGALGADLLLWPGAADGGAAGLGRRRPQPRAGAGGVRPPGEDECTGGAGRMGAGTRPGGVRRANSE